MSIDESYCLVECQICKEKKQQLNVHINKKHNMTVDEYKNKFPGFPITSQKIIDAIKLDKTKTKEKRSKKAKQDFADGKRKIPTKNGRGDGGRRGDLNNTYFRARWEANIARILELFKIEYVYEKKIKLEDENGELMFTYVVDFYLPKYDKYIEVKGKWEESAIKKVEMFKQKYGDKKLIVIEKSLYDKLEKRFAYRIPFWENDKKNITKTPEIYENKDLKVENHFEKCLVCKMYFNDWMKHLIHSKDGKHLLFYDNQISLIKSLFHNHEVNPHTDLLKYGVHFKYKQCIRVWHKTFSKEERKGRADMLTKLGNIRTKNKKGDKN